MDWANNAVFKDVTKTMKQVNLSVLLLLLDENCDFFIV